MSLRAEEPLEECSEWPVVADIGGLWPRDLIKLSLAAATIKSRCWRGGSRVLAWSWSALIYGPSTETLGPGCRAAPPGQIIGPHSLKLCPAVRHPAAMRFLPNSSLSLHHILQTEKHHKVQVVVIPRTMGRHSSVYWSDVFSECTSWSVLVVVVPSIGSFIPV